MRRTLALVVVAGLIWPGCSDDTTAPADEGHTAASVGVAFVPSDSFDLWLTDPANGEVVRIDGTSGEITAVVDVGGSPVGIVVGAGAIWVGDCLEQRLHRISIATATVTDTLEVGGCVADLAVTDDMVGVDDLDGNRVLGIDPATVQIVTEYETPDGANSVTAGSLYIGSAAGTITAIDDAGNRTTLWEPRGHGFEWASVFEIDARWGILWVTLQSDQGWWLLALDPATGEVQYEWETDAHTYRLTAANGVVYLPVPEEHGIGYVDAFPQTGQPGPGDTPMLLDSEYRWVDFGDRMPTDVMPGPDDLIVTTADGDLTWLPPAGLTTSSKYEEIQARLDAKFEGRTLKQGVLTWRQWKEMATTAAPQMCSGTTNAGDRALADGIRHRLSEVRDGDAYTAAVGNVYRADFDSPLLQELTEAFEAAIGDDTAAAWDRATRGLAGIEGWGMAADPDYPVSSDNPRRTFLQLPEPGPFGDRTNPVIAVSACF